MIWLMLHLSAEESLVPITPDLNSLKTVFLSREKSESINQNQRQMSLFSKSIQNLFLCDLNFNTMFKRIISVLKKLVRKFPFCRLISAGKFLNCFQGRKY